MPSVADFAARFEIRLSGPRVQAGLSSQQEVAGISPSKIFRSPILGYFPRPVSGGIGADCCDSSMIFNRFQSPAELQILSFSNVSHFQNFVARVQYVLKLGAKFVKRSRLFEQKCQHFTGLPIGIL